ncbi:GAF domain-containing protein [Candidatus Sororendozoicomonas aggregata]|uniref:GAF domain-containing protein n=1 Tax=Candidatus Sororendozoicomonas aggregata TaxID=3073239 RepID=UPI002ED222C2
MFDIPAEQNTSYSLLVTQVDALCRGESDTLANLANVASLLYITLTEVNWVGFYIVRGEELVLGPFQGKPACVRIPFGKGVCGNVASMKKSLMVNNVEAFPGHIACDADSRSEIVLPLFKNDELVAVLDIDSPVPERFTDDDLQGLSDVVSALQPLLDLSQLLYHG